MDGKVSNGLWRLDLESLQWSPVQQANKPPPRHSAGLVADKEQRLVLYSGDDENDVRLTDLHIFSVKDGEWCCNTTNFRRQFNYNSQMLKYMFV